MTNKPYEIEHEPNPEFAGYCWHIPECDPTQWEITLKPDSGDPHIPVYILWPCGEVYMIWGADHDFICIGMVKYDKEEDRFYFEGMSIEDRYEISRMWDDGEKIDYYLSQIEDQIADIVDEYAKEWPSCEEWEKMFPDGGALRAPIS